MTTALHFLQPELDPLRDAISFYVHGRGWWLLTAGLLALDAASFVVVSLLPRDRRAARVLLMIWCLGVLLGAIFPADPLGSWTRPPSVSGAIHGNAAVVAFVALPLSALLAGGPRRVRWLAALCAVSLIVFVASLAPAFTGHPPRLLGLTERILVASYCWWLIAAATALQRTDTRSGEALPQCYTRKTQAAS
jgi:hypothetical protein